MFSQRLREIRIAANYTQQKTADALGITLRSYQRYESANCEPPISTLIAIANLFDISLDYLLCRDEWLESHVALADESR